MSGSIEAVGGADAVGGNGPPASLPPSIIDAANAAHAADTTAEVTQSDGSVSIVVVNAAGLVVSKTTVAGAHTTREVSKPDGSVTVVVTDAVGHVLSTTTIEPPTPHVQLHHVKPILNIAV